jgi:hypothetical protein
MGRHVLETFAYLRPGSDRNTIIQNYRPLWAGAIIDSGAFSVHMSGTPVSLEEYRGFLEAHGDFYDAIAGLDVISDWRGSVANWRAMEDLGVFPTFHEGEPRELLLEYAQEQAARGGWLGFGAQRPIVPARVAAWLRECRDVRGDLVHKVHCHGFGLSMYVTAFPFASTDSTAWIMGVHKLLGITQLNHLTKRELMDIMYARLTRAPHRVQWDPGWATLLSKVEAGHETLQPEEDALELFAQEDGDD